MKGAKYNPAAPHSPPTNGNRETCFFVITQLTATAKFADIDMAQTASKIVLMMTRTILREDQQWASILPH
jgi:hypothetical protein